ncbi:PAS domain-containing sensor histidine kinase [Stappia sp.]|uniref:PAS domain-containing sensor histidine kinase n=1 Tax=Stappia sp. TaxID=1870903 RepID=UPI0032D8E25C
MMSVFADLLRHLNASVDALVHSSVAQDAAQFRRQRAFIVGHLAGGALALAALPMVLALHGPAPLPLALVFAWATSQIPLAMMVSRSGELARAQTIAAVLSATFFAGLAALSGGPASPVLPLLLLAPLEAAFTSSRRAVAGVLVWCLALGAGLWLPSLLGVGAPAPTAQVAGWLSVETLALALGLALATLLALRLVTELRAAQRQTDTARARQARLAAHGGQAVAEHGEGGRIVTLTPNARTVTGLSPEALIGEGFFARLHVADRPLFLKALSDTAADGVARDIALRLRTGDTRPGEAGIAGYRTLGLSILREGGQHDGKAGAVVSVLRDLEPVRALEAERDAALARAAAAEEARSRFLATVSHELRTPLNAILGFSDLLRQTGAQAPDATPELAKTREYAELMHASGAHLLQVVNDMLDMARIEADQVRLVAEPFDARACLDGCRRMMVPEADRAGVRLSTDIPQDLGLFVGDSRACRQIVLNLVANAVKFTPEGGRIVLFARRENGGLAFGVRDTGIGMSAEDVARVTEPFVQASTGLARSHEGIGLGLAVVKGLAELHGGRLTLDSRPNEGTCASVFLPARAANAPAKVAVLDQTAGAAAAPVSAEDGTTPLQRIA